MKKRTHDLLVAAYKQWVEIGVAVLRKAQGPMNAVTANMISKVKELETAGIDPLPKLQEIRSRLKRAIFEDPARLSTSYYISPLHREELAELDSEIGRLEAKEG